MGRILLVLSSLLGLCVLSSAQNGTLESGSGSGSGMPMMRNCSDLRCSHGCNQTDTGPACYCPMGYSLGQDMMTCQPCPGGLWGVGCSIRCNCSTGGNTCNRRNGMCVCNPCYTGDQCQDESNLYDCFVQFLGMTDKSFSNLRNTYGQSGFPVPPEAVRDRLVADGIMETNANLISNVQFESISRTSVGQGPLVKLSWLVDKNFDRVEAERALRGLSDKVKLGDIRATYIAQDSTDNTLVTLNSGVKDDPI